MHSLNWRARPSTTLWPMKNYEYRFKIKSGRYVYIPTQQARVLGDQIQETVLKRWKPAGLFYHLHRRGGHVAAMRRHGGSRYFARRDISHFFGSVTRTKVARALRDIGFDNKTAFEIASASVVSSEIGKHLPYGFVQSPVLATLALERSALGSFVIGKTPGHLVVTIFADDIMMSSDNESSLREYGEALDESAAVAKFAFGSEKTAICELTVEAFNCLIKHRRIEITPERMARFADQMKVASPMGRAAILRYVAAINMAQAVQLAQLNV